MIETTGHTWDQVNEDWDLPRYNAWISHCEEFPPLRAMVQAYLGIESKPKVSNANDVPTLLNVLSSFPGAVMKP